MKGSIAPKVPSPNADTAVEARGDTTLQRPDDVIYKICAAPIGEGGRYYAWPDKVTYVRRFPTARRRDTYWKRYVKPKGSDYHGLTYQIIMVDEWSGGWRFVGDPVYADVPLIGKVTNNVTSHIVEVGDGAPRH